MMVIVLSLLITLCILGYSLIPTYGYKIRQRCGKSRTHQVLYLTFDDGPHPRYTPQLLDLLQRYHIKASFFVVASFAKENPQIISRMKEQGHLIGLHSLGHKNELWQTPYDTKQDFTHSMDVMANLAVKVRYFRPPWGHFNLSALMQIRKHGLRPILWDVMAEDWLGNTTVETITKKLIHRTAGGDIICLHDGRGKKEAPHRTIRALELVLPFWCALGYKFETVDNYENK